MSMSFDSYADFFAGSFIQDVITEHQLRLLIFDPEREEVVLWIN
ncbi:hypothetical protein [Coleofasciculus chthonoplastes]